MKFNIIHQPRRSGKTLYAVRKAYDNLINGKSTLVFPLEEKEFFSKMINYLNKKQVKYYAFNGTIFLEEREFADKDTTNISISNSKELKKVYEERKIFDKEAIEELKENYHDIIFDDVHNNFFKKAEEIYKMLKTCCNIKNIPEVRFTYKIMYNQKQLELKQLKRLIEKYIISYKEIQSDTKLDNYYNNNDSMKKCYCYEENPLPYNIEVIGKLLDTFVCKCDMAKRKELLEIIATSDREDIIHNAKEELRDMEV